jgi:CHAD domain-containing protein
MAKAKQAIGPGREADPQEWLDETLHARFKEIVDKTPAAIDPGKVKDVHHLRVAIRRLHSLIGDVNEIFDAASLKRLRKELKKRSKLLGRVRDRDVYIEALKELTESAENGRYAKAIEAQLTESRSARRHAHGKLSKALSDDSLDDLKKQFSSAVDSALAQPGLFRPANVPAAGREVISARLKDLADLASDIYDPFDEDGLHEIRIAAKRLRYALEAFASVFGDEAQKLADELARMQTFLGDLHDYDLWISNLRQQLRDDSNNHTPNSSDRKAVAWMLSEFVKKRTDSYRSALDLWTTWETNAFGDKLNSLISL